MGKKCQLIWRTTVPGHPKCKSFIEPSKSLAEIEGGMGRKSFTVPPKKNYWWSEFKHQNILALLALSHSLDYDILPAYEINLLRPDDHKKRDDCLHSCVPGKAAVYNQALLHLMLLHQQDETTNA
jgi:hypothetical protein